MDWLLILVISWIGQPIALQIPMESEALCEAAVRKAPYEMLFVPGSRDKPGGAQALNPGIKVSAVCLRVAGKPN